MTREMRKTAPAIAGALLLLGAGSAVAQTAPPDVEDLVGVRASGGEIALLSRDYRFVRAEEREDGKDSFWWNGSREVCVSVTTRNGRYRAIVEQPDADCGQPSAAK
jgi:hypothetical protein